MEYLGTELMEVGDSPADWTEEDRGVVRKTFINLLILSNKLRDNEEDPIESLVSGFSLKTCRVMVPVEHDLKAMLRFYTMDFLLLSIKGGKGRNQLRERILASDSANAKNFSDYFYTHSAVAMFLNNRSKWDCLPAPMLMLVRMLEIIAHQYISSNVSDFYCLTFAASIFLHRQLCLSLKEEVHFYPQTADFKKKKKRKGTDMRNLLEEGSLWYHSLTHSVDQLIDTRLPLLCVAEGIADQQLGQLKAAFQGRTSNSPDDLPRLILQLVEEQKFKLEKGLENKREKEKRCTDPPPRLDMCFAPCFAVHSVMREVFQSFLIHCEQKPYHSMVKQHQRIHQAYLLTASDTLLFNQDLSVYAEDPNYLFFSFCGAGTCDTCAP
jgi:hypothetical protein